MRHLMKNKNLMIIAGMLAVIAIIGVIGLTGRTTAPAVEVQIPADILQQAGTLPDLESFPAPAVSDKLGSFLPANFLIANACAEDAAGESGSADAASEMPPYKMYALVVFAGDSSGSNIRLLPLPLLEEDAYTYPLMQYDAEGNEYVNNLRIEKDRIYMESANCDNQDCVDEGEVTLENRTTRILGNYIVCSPHMLYIQLVTRDELIAATQANQAQ